MKPDDSQLVLLRIEDKAKYEEAIAYMYAGTDPEAVHKPITIYKEKNANAVLSRRALCKLHRYSPQIQNVE